MQQHQQHQRQQQRCPSRCLIILALMKAGLSEGFRFPVEPIPHVCNGGGGHLRGGASHQLVHPRTKVPRSLEHSFRPIQPIAIVRHRPFSDRSSVRGGEGTKMDDQWKTTDDGSLDIGEDESNENGSSNDNVSFDRRSISSI